ncbi:Calcium-binding protein A [Spatholobus suberectus]|nr:Calcium-binding protein A [Spatholobus suberectus]
MPVFIPPMPEYKSKGLPPTIIDAEKKIRDILTKADCNGDGCLSKEELKKAFKEFGSKMPAWRASRFLRKADTNHDGVLTMEELDIIVDYALARWYKFKK